MNAVLVPDTVGKLHLYCPASSGNTSLIIRIEKELSGKVTTLSLSSGKRTCVPAAMITGLSSALSDSLVHHIYIKDKFISQFCKGEATSKSKMKH